MDVLTKWDLLPGGVVALIQPATSDGAGAQFALY